MIRQPRRASFVIGTLVAASSALVGSARVAWAQSAYDPTAPTQAPPAPRPTATPSTPSVPPKTPSPTQPGQVSWFTSLGLDVVVPTGWTHHGGTLIDSMDRGAILLFASKVDFEDADDQAADFDQGDFDRCAAWERETLAGAYDPGHKPPNVIPLPSYVPSGFHPRAFIADHGTDPSIDEGDKTLTACVPVGDTALTFAVHLLADMPDAEVAEVRAPIDAVLQAARVQWAPGYAPPATAKTTTGPVPAAPAATASPTGLAPGAAPPSGAPSVQGKASPRHRFRGLRATFVGYQLDADAPRASPRGLTVGLARSTIRSPVGGVSFAYGYAGAVGYQGDGAIPYDAHASAGLGLRLGELSIRPYVGVGFDGMASVPAQRYGLAPAPYLFLQGVISIVLGDGLLLNLDGMRARRRHEVTPGTAEEETRLAASLLRRGYGVGIQSVSYDGAKAVGGSFSVLF